MYEYYHRLHLGRPGTEVKFIRWHYGPYAEAIIDQLDELMDFRFVDGKMSVNPYGKPTYTYSAGNTSPELISEEMEIADFVLNLLRRKPYQPMIDTVYSTPPMLKVLLEEEEHGESLEGVELDMDYTKSTFKRTRAGRAAAQSRIAKMGLPKVPNPEYWEVLVSEYQDTEPLRRRALGVADKSNSK
jgi:hypothetical protein